MERRQVCPGCGVRLRGGPSVVSPQSGVILVSSLLSLGKLYGSVMLILWRCSRPRGDQTAFISHLLLQHLLGAELVMFPLPFLTKYSTHTHDHTLGVAVWKVHDSQGVMSCVCLSSCFNSLPVPLMKPHWGLWLPCTIRPAPVGPVCCCTFKPSLHKDSDCFLWPAVFRLCGTLLLPVVSDRGATVAALPLNATTLDAFLIFAQLQVYILQSCPVHHC